MCLRVCVVLGCCWRSDGAGAKKADNSRRVPRVIWHQACCEEKNSAPYPATINMPESKAQYRAPQKGIKKPDPRPLPRNQKKNPRTTDHNSKPIPTYAKIRPMAPAPRNAPALFQQGAGRGAFAWASPGWCTAAPRAARSPLKPQNRGALVGILQFCSGLSVGFVCENERCLSFVCVVLWVPFWGWFTGKPNGNQPSGSPHSQTHPYGHHVPPKRIRLKTKLASPR